MNDHTDTDTDTVLDVEGRPGETPIIQTTGDADTINPVERAIRAAIDEGVREATAGHTCTVPKVEVATDLLALLRLALPDYVSGAIDESGEHLTIVLQGVAVDEDGALVPTSKPVVVPDTVTFTVVVDSVEVPDVYIDGFDLLDLVRHNVDLGEHIAEAFGYGTAPSIGDTSADSTDDLYVTVEATATLEFEDVAIGELGLDTAEYDSVDDLLVDLRDAIRVFVSDALGCSSSDVSVDEVLDGDRQPITA